MGGNNEFFENFERNKYLKKLPSMQRVNQQTVLTIDFATLVGGCICEVNIILLLMINCSE